MVTLISIVLILTMWYFYPLYIASNIKGKIASIKNLQKLKSIQIKTLVIIASVYVCSCVLVGFFPRLNAEGVNISKIDDTILFRLKNNQPTLISVSNKWSLQSLRNRLFVNKAKKHGVAVISIDTTVNTDNAKYWLNNFNRTRLPLYVLFTNRHRNGLVLPQNLRDINFRESIKSFQIN